MKHLAMLFALTIVIAQNLQARQAERSVVLQSDGQKQIMTGNLQIDLFGKQDIGPTFLVQDQSPATSEISRKSPWLAAGLSAVVPGAGEFYAENYWKAALFLAIDVAAWTIAYTSDKKGDDQTVFFQGIANEKWNVVKYAQYSLDKFLALPEVPADRRAAINAGLIINPSASLPSQRVNWTLMHEFEDYISRSQTGKYYSHRLPEYGEQQYFELIGKYPQFNPGWFDAPDNWEYSETNVSPTLKYYAVERGKANDYYSRATTFVTVAVVNHVLSALDAAWSASNFNKHVHTSVRIQRIPTEYGVAQVPVARVEYSF
jgi:hypothetical protein